MPITADDVEFRLATLAGTAGNEELSAPGGSNGRWVSTTVLDSGSMSNLFPEITAAERTSNNVDYQCVFLYNKHDVLTVSGAKIWLSAETTGVADIAIAVDSIPASVISSTLRQATAIADKDVTPTGVSTFSSPTTEGTALSLGSVGPGEVRAFWVRRTAIGDSPRQDDGVTLTIRFDEAQAT